jgi:hypothetical protein
MSKEKHGVYFGVTVDKAGYFRVFSRGETQFLPNERPVISSNCKGGDELAWQIDEMIRDNTLENDGGNQNAKIERAEGHRQRREDRARKSAGRGFARAKRAAAQHKAFMKADAKRRESQSAIPPAPDEDDDAE